MSGNGFHVHGPHDHEMEHAAHGSDSYANRLATATAILATLAVIFSYMGGATLAESLMDKSTASIKKTEAANMWAYYQAKSTKQALMQLGTDLPGMDKARYDKEIQRYDGEKKDIKKRAEALEAEAVNFDTHSEAMMHVHHRWSQAGTIIQLAIALAAISLLTRKTPLNYLLGAISIAGISVAGMAAFHL